MSSTNYGRLQGDVGRQSWALFPGLEGGYLYGRSGDGHDRSADTEGNLALSRTVLSKMSKDELIEAALALQHELRQKNHG